MPDSAIRVESTPPAAGRVNYAVAITTGLISVGHQGAHPKTYVRFLRASVPPFHSRRSAVIAGRAFRKFPRALTQAQLSRLGPLHVLCANAWTERLTQFDPRRFRLYRRPWHQRCGHIRAYAQPASALSTLRPRRRRKRFSPSTAAGSTERSAMGINKTPTIVGFVQEFGPERSCFINISAHRRGTITTIDVRKGSLFHGAVAVNNNRPNRRTFVMNAMQHRIIIEALIGFAEERDMVKV